MTAVALPAECRALLEELEAPSHLIMHAGIVARAAGALAVLCHAGVEHCVAAGWLHDAGKAPGAIQAAAKRTGEDPASLARMDHGRLGAIVLRELGSRFSPLAPAVESHAINCVLTGPAPKTPEEEVVFLADKLVGMEWMGFRGRTSDIVNRYGDRYDVRAALPGTELVFVRLAASACLGRGDLERMVETAVAGDGGDP